MNTEINTEKFSTFQSAFLITVFQICIALALTPHDPRPLSAYIKVPPPQGWEDSVDRKSELERRYLRLNNWDSLRYFEIAKNGYHTLPISELKQNDIEFFRANVVFFPAYPVLAGLIHQHLGVSIQLSLLLLAQASTLVFWIYFFSILKLWKISRRTIQWATVFVLSFPTTFYMVMGYSESLFLAFLMGFLYWTELAVYKEKLQEKHHRWTQNPLADWIWAGLHGFGMCATRLMGLPLLIFPVARSMNKLSSTQKTSVLVSILVSLFASLGTFSFFFYCWMKFGDWNLYSKINQIGWGVSYSPWAILNPKNYLPYYFFENTEISLDRSIAPATLACLSYAALKDPQWKARIGFYVAILALLYLLMSSKAEADFISMARHGQTLFILIVLAFVHFPSPAEPRTKKWFWFRTILLTTFIVLQIYLSYRFLKGSWVE